MTGALAQSCDTERVATGIDLTLQQNVTLQDGVTASFTTHEDNTTVVIDGGGATQQFALENYWAHDRDPEQVLTIDINGDDRLDLFVGIGLGMVNADYTLLLSAPDGTWHDAGLFTDPSFCEDAPGFLTSARSGPHWFISYWPMGDNGRPYRQIEQSTFDGIIDRRKTFDQTGTMTHETVVISATALFDTPAPVQAQLKDPSGTITLYDVSNRQTATQTRASGTPVTVLTADEDGFTIALNDGTAHFVRRDTLTIDLN